MNKAQMYVAQAWPEIMYRLVVPDLKKSLDLIMVTSAAVGGIIDKQGGVIDFTDTEPKVPTGENVSHYVEDIQLSEEDIEEFKRVDDLYRKQKSDEFFDATNNLIARLYERMETPDELKQNRLKVCFGK